MPTVLGGLSLRCAHGDGPFEHGVDVIDVPIDNDPGPAIAALGSRNVFAVDDAKLMLVITDPELDVPRPFEVRLHTKELRVPPRRCHMIGREEANRAHPAKRGCHSHRPWPPALLAAHSARYRPICLFLDIMFRF